MNDRLDRFVSAIFNLNSSPTQNVPQVGLSQIGRLSNLRDV
jgi:hypothetical protein